MNTTSSTCRTIMGIIRIALWLVMLYFGVMKVFGPVETHAMIGGAAHKVGLTFLSLETWFWIATIGEILAGIFLTTGHRYRIGAVLTLIVMAFAINAVGPGWLPIATALAALAVLIWGAGKWRVCCCRYCMKGDMGGCCGKCMGCKDGKSCTCASEHHAHMQQQQQQQQ